MSKNNFYLCEAAKGGLMVMNSIGVKPIKSVLYIGSLRDVKSYLEDDQGISVTLGALKKQLYTIGYWQS